MIAIYARQSIDKGEASLSIETQVQKCEEYIKFKELKKKGEKTKIFEDRGFSGKNTDRPSFIEMMEYVEREKISHILCYRLDRISRNVVDFYSVYGKLQEHNVNFISCMEDFNTSSSMGKFTMSILINFAEMEREGISQRVKDSYYQRARSEGRYLGGRKPMGWDFGKDERGLSSLIPNPKEIKIVEFIFYSYAFERTTSLYSIRKKIFETYGIIKTQTVINGILQNPIYTSNDIKIYNYYRAMGCQMLNDVEEWDGSRSVGLINKTNQSKDKTKFNDKKEWVVYCANWQGIIEPRIFLMCQERLKENKSFSSSNRSKNKFKELSGLVKCAKCGHAVKITGKYGTLSCTGRSEHHGLCDCSFPKLRVEHIQDKVNIEMQKYIDDFESQQIKQRKKKIKIQTQINTYEKEIKNLIDIMARNPSIEELIIKQIEERKNKRDKLILQRQSDIDVGDKIAYRVLQLFNPFFNDDEEIKKIIYADMDEDQKKSFLKIVVSKILLFEDGNIEIIYN